MFEKRAKVLFFLWNQTKICISFEILLMKKICCSLSILFAFNFLAQSQVVIKILAKERTNGDPISRVQIRQFTGDSLIQTEFTNSKGYALFQVSSIKPTRFECDHVAFEPLNQLPEKIFQAKKGDTLFFTVRFYYSRERLIDEVVIKPTGVPDTVFESTRVSVADFEFLPSDNMLLLTYPKNQNKATELVISNGFAIQGEVPLQEIGTDLIRDYKGNVHVVTEKMVYGIVEKKNSVGIAPIEKKYFDTYIKPIVDSSHAKYFFSNYNPYYPEFSYFSYNVNDSVYQKLKTVKDDLMMELYRSEFKWVDVRTKLWAKEKEKETGIDKEIWVGMNYFTQSIYYKELYAPLFKKNDTLFLLDHYKNWLYAFDGTGKLLDSVSIYYHLQPKEDGWKNELIQDDVTEEIYAKYQVGSKTYLRKLNTKTGRVGKPVQLYFPYPASIHVHRNFVYYIYRPFESIQKKFMYRERLPEDL